MQLSPTAATPPPAPAPASPTRFSAQQVLPHEMQVARIGRGTVRSEVNRSIRVLLEGSGPASERELVPDSKAAADLMASKDGPTFTKALRSFLAVADEHQGKENLKSVTFLPDEHASKAVSVLNWADNARRDGLDVDAMLQPDKGSVEQLHKQIPDLSKDEIRSELRKIQASEGVKMLAEGEAEQVSFAGAWNSNGHIVMMPDVSRDMLSTIGLYRQQPGDQLTKLPPKYRDDQARWSWHAAIHEAEHSITPMGNRGPEWTSVMEEAIPEVLTPSRIDPTLRAAGADPDLAARPARDTKHEPVDWAAWNRDHLPRPAASEMATAKGRYTDGPELVRDLLRMAGIDRRTTEGKAAALELLQGRSAKFAPRRIADAIVAAKQLPDSAAPKLADLIRQASIGEHTMGDIERFVRDSAS
ncbi:MAG: hypothetical protein KDC46_15050 [Thermoleophilia bacterium]|nr:hypothetical protein [Thermoleophilia bacterium]